jgi:crotonobetainyl-CoA:carnitine CoA-transferase CaiB-like acyl-CoA transferase
MTVGSAPTIGQHTKEILSDVLGYEDDYINQLVSDEIIRCD